MVVFVDTYRLLCCGFIWLLVAFGVVRALVRLFIYCLLCFVVVIWVLHAGCLG